MGNRLLRSLHRTYASVVTWVNLPVSFSSFFAMSSSGTTLRNRIVLLWRMHRNNKAIPSASHFLEHLTIATRMLELPRAVEGRVVECGTYKGGSAANLSLACALAGRRLEVFDSFEGLPKPTSDDQAHLVLDRLQIHSYDEGDWRGTTGEVSDNIARYGDPSVVSLHPGYFEQTLPEFQAACIVVFADVDLVSSLETCLKYLWPLLVDGGYFFTHEARHLEISGLFFDDAWWQTNLGCEAPGLIGAGSGIGLLPSGTGFRSDLGYTIKNPHALQESRQTGAGSDRARK